MSVSKSNEMFINMKYHPSEDSSEYEAFVLQEIEKCRKGIVIDGVHISGWLYWHINHWKIQGDDDEGFGERPIITPKLRDNEWIIANAIERAETDKKALCCLGLRQFGKTQMASSYLARKAVLIKNSQNIIVGSSAEDLNNITASIDFGMLQLPKYLSIPRITRDWSKKEVLLGIKRQSGDNDIHSRFRIRNTQDGAKTEVTAGATISSLFFDEIGKQDFSKVFQAAKPALRGPKGWRCSPLLFGTGGAFEKGKDAEVMFFNPENSDILDFIDENTNKKTGLFMPGYMRSDFKESSTLGKYLNLDSKKLDKIPIQVANIERGIGSLKKEREIAAGNPDTSVLLKAIMYDPLVVDEIFLTESGNIFPKDLLMDQKAWLAAGNAPHCDYVDLYVDSNNLVKHKFTDRKPIMHFPARPEDDLDGVVQIWEFPIHNAPEGLYFGATDPYKQESAAYSDSVGSTYIFKRIYDPINDKFQNIIVAAYHGRPKRMQTWYDNTRMLLRYFNAKTVCENEDRGFIQHCKDKNDAHVYLVPQVAQIINGVHPNSTVQREYGIHATRQLINYFNVSIVEYMQEVLRTEDDKEILGVRRIIDPVLIEELLKYDGKMNADRVRSYGILLAYAKSLDRAPLSSIKDNRYKPMEMKGNMNKSNPFRKGVSPFTR